LESLGGIYTATEAQTLSIDTDISWKGGVSNLGQRTLQIIYKPFAGLPLVAKEAITQAEPDTQSETCQAACIFLQLQVGDQAWVQVFHTAPMNLIISGGNHTSVCGLSIE
jgi:hypothetical protein